MQLMQLLVKQKKRIMRLALRPVPQVKRWRQRMFLLMLSDLLFTTNRARKPLRLIQGMKRRSAMGRVRRAHGA